ncbi:MAG TPA: TAXI family TRAP transporter solute-binding subunit [Rhodoblastus sp.]|nr:TAXI family TRAP transporter solute-binding subunit [Rhodoblastus sp.]
MLRGLYIASAVGLALAGAAVAVNYVFLRPAVLRVAVAQGTDDHRLVDAIGRAFAVHRDGVRLRVVPVGTASASSAALQSESVDLAVVRSDIAVPSNGQTLVILHRNPALLIARGDDAIGSVSDLKGKTVGIVRGVASGVGNVTLFDTILAHYEIDPQLVRHEVLGRDGMADAIKSRQVDALFVVGPATANISGEAVAAVVRASGSAKFIPIAESKAIAQRFSALESTEIVRGAFGGDPPRPADAFETIGVSVRLMARASLQDSIAAEITRRLFAERPSIARLEKLANQIEAPATDKGAAMPVHPGAAAYLDDEEESFFDKYSDFIYLGAMALSVIGSAFAAVATRISHTRHTEFDRLLERLLEILKSARTAGRVDDLDEMEREADEILVSSFASRHLTGLDSHAMTAMGLALEQVRDAIRERRGVLRKQSLRPVEASRIALGE